MKPRTPELRGLIKIHKENAPIRPIINSINAPTYKLAKMFARKLQTHIPLPNVCNIKNSAQLIEELAEIPISSHVKLASLDITNMLL
jgi:hypothetical protein